MITTIMIDTVDKSKLPEMYSKTLEKFEKLLTTEHCQMVNVTASEVTHSFCSNKQIITIIWTGESKNIKSNYRASIIYGLFGTTRDIELTPC